MKSKISCWRFVRSLPMSMPVAVSSRGGRTCVRTRYLPPRTDSTPLSPQGYTRRSRADGGIGRRARLRAWSGLTGWRFESSSAHLERPRVAGLFAFEGREFRRWRDLPPRRGASSTVDLIDALADPVGRDLNVRKLELDRAPRVGGKTPCFRCVTIAGPSHPVGLMCAVPPGDDDPRRDHPGA